MTDPKDPFGEVEITKLIAEMELPPDPDKLKPIILGRSELEHYEVCPFQAWACETGKVKDVSPEMDAGTEAHKALAAGISSWVDHGQFDVEEVMAVAYMSRPDVQREALAGIKGGLYSLRKFLTTKAPADVKRYSGGEGERSGQVMRQLLPATNSRGPIILTAELDLLIACASPEELLDIDFKTGHQIWNCDDVVRAFQFQSHNWILRNPDPPYFTTPLRTLRVRVWDTRTGVISSTVHLGERDATAFEGRALEAVRYANDARGGVEAPCWPAFEKCATCPAAHLCPAVMKPIAEYARDPGQFLGDTHAMAGALEQRIKVLKAARKVAGKDLEAGSVRFGGDRPKEKRSPTMELYEAPETEK